MRFKRGDMVMIDPRAWKPGSKSGSMLLRREYYTDNISSLLPVSSPGSVNRSSVMTVLEVMDASPRRPGSTLRFDDVKVLTSDGTIGWVFEENLVIVQ